MSSQANRSSSNVPGEINSQWPASRFRCPHCPFIGCNKYSLGSHIHYHSVRLSLQCSFCTFSVSSKNVMMRHMNRVHPEEALKFAVKKKIPKKRRPIITTISTKSPEVVTEDISTENEVHVIEDQEFDEEEVMVIEHDPENPCCLSCGKEQGSDQSNKMVHCNECESWFHASCVNLMDGQLDSTKHWFCPLCIHKETPLSHLTKLNQAIACFSKVYHGIDGQIGGDEHIGVNQSNTTLIPTNESNLSEEKEEMQCLKELDQLSEDIRAIRANLAQASKEMEAEARQIKLSRANKAENLRQRMETLKITEQGLSIELAVLMEQKRRVHLEETEKTKLKTTADRELFDLKFSSCRKMKQEASSSSSSSLGDENEQHSIQKKERLVVKLKKKLEEIGKEERDLIERIQTTQMELEKNNKNLVELRRDLESLRAFPAAATSSSSIAVRIKALKSEVRERVNRFAYLEEHLILLNSSRIIEDIRQKKKEWLDSYDCDDEA